MLEEGDETIAVGADGEDEGEDDGGDGRGARRKYLVFACDW